MTNGCGSSAHRRDGQPQGHHGQTVAISLAGAGRRHSVDRPRRHARRWLPRPRSCSASLRRRIGDETIANFNVPAFLYGGDTYTRIGVDSNGYIVVGGGTSADNDCCTPDVP